MPGLTITTGGTPVAGATGAGAGSQPPPQPPNPQPSSAAASASASATSSRRGSRASRASSPSRPPVSPITPTLGPTQLPGGAPSTSQMTPLPSSASTNIPNFAQGRPIFTHSQPDQAAISQLPPTQPISFDDNPDVLALKSAISILQLQRARAQADMQALNQAKAAALADPAAFIADLTEGRVVMEGDPLLSSQPRRSSVQPPEEEDSSSSSSSDDDDDDEEGEDKDGDTSMKNTKSKPETSPKEPTSKRKKGKLKTQQPNPDANKTWRKLPKPQTVVRMPPINWAQYGVVGESLDKLHAEQIAAPTSGTPVPLGPGGVFEFKAATEQMIRDEQQQAQLNLHQPLSQQRLPGIAAPYVPGKDKMDVGKEKEKEKEKKGGRAGKR